MTRSRLGAILALAALTAACGGDPGPPSRAPSASAASAPVAASVAPAASDRPLTLPEPGRPFTAADVLSAMRSSTRPGGVPAQLQTEAIAEAVAGAVWTFGGEPWTAMTASGSCGASACHLELAGAPAGSAGEDVWAFEVDPTDGAIDVLTADLHGLPAVLVEDLEARVREAAGDRLGGDLLLTAVRWLPPPDDGVFRLAYRSGDEEGSCSADVTFDAAAGSIEDIETDGC